VLAELREAWSVKRRCLDRLALTEPVRDALRQIVALGPHPADRLDVLRTEGRQTFLAARQAQEGPRAPVRSWAPTPPGSATVSLPPGTANATPPAGSPKSFAKAPAGSGADATQ